MLSNQTVTIVKSTAPILQEHGEALTRHFYKRMFEHNPEVGPFFNPANQAAGKQQRALAAAIAAYAANVDNLGALGQAVELIAQKHASLLIQPEHYPIVGANLLASISEVLGGGATEAVIAAWAEAYGFLADLLIEREEQIYRENAEKTGGWVGFKPFRMLRKQVESANISSFYLWPSDGSQPPAFKPGQYITVRVPSADGRTTMRNYSLSDRPGMEYFRISVKREQGTPDGYVSNRLHDHLHEGMEVELAPPCGEFFLDLDQTASRPLVLLAAGVGITPLLSMLESAVRAWPARKIVLIQASLNEEVQGFRPHLEALAEEHPNLKLHFRYSQPVASGQARAGRASTGLVDGALIESLVPDRDADYFFCGPQPFMVGIYHRLLGWGLPPAQVHFEFFGPRQVLEDQATDPQADLDKNDPDHRPKSSPVLTLQVT